MAIRVNNYKFSAFLNSRGTCLGCNKRMTGLKLRFMAPFKKEYVLCWDCLMNYVLSLVIYRRVFPDAKQIVPNMQLEEDLEVPCKTNSSEPVGSNLKQEVKESENECPISNLKSPESPVILEKPNP